MTAEGETAAPVTGEAGNDRPGVAPAAKWLGGLGAIPFVALALAVPLLDGAPRQQAHFALAAYGAEITRRMKDE